MADDLSELMDRHASFVIALPPGDPLSLGQAVEHQHQLLVWAGVADDAARDLLAREHYFRTHDKLRAHADRVIDRRFETAADAIAAGDITSLQRCLAEDPALATARSAYGHRQTLLHHLAGNGIEWARQRQTPANACELARTLITAGADPNVTCESYAPTDTVLTLLCSSAHPAEAGVQAALVETLVQGGAAVDGPDGNSDPLWTAVVWGYHHAVDALVRCGAGIDNLVLAAAAGDLDRVRALLAEPRRPLPMGHMPHVLEAEHLVEYALIYAASLDRADVVRYLLAQNPDLSIHEPMWRATALGAASHPHPSAGRPDGNPAIVALLSAQ